MNWNVHPEALTLGHFVIRWYGLFFASGILACYFVLKNKVWPREGLKEPELDRLATYVVVGTVIGARLGHTLFYQPSFFLTHPLEILKVWKGGLASHGAAIGILTAIWFYARRIHVPYLWATDRVALVVPLAGTFIRIGNLLNSEIIGRPTTVPWAVRFLRVDSLPRHPAQIYEALSYCGIFVALYFYYSKYGKQTPRGSLSGAMLFLVFTTRFLLEFVKEVQEPFEASLPLKMGQLLSVPFILLGLILMILSWRASNRNKAAQREN